MSTAVNKMATQVSRVSADWGMPASTLPVSPRREPPSSLARTDRKEEASWEAK